MRITLVLLFVAVSSAFAEDAPLGQCGEMICTHRDLKSEGDRVEQEIEGAAFIRTLTLEASEGYRCKAKNPTDTKIYWGKDPAKPAFWVNYGCQGHFKICYVPGVCKDYTLSSVNADYKHNLTLTDSCSIEAMTCVRQHSGATANCTMDVTYTFYNNFAKVGDGCSCDFSICHTVKTGFGADSPTTPAVNLATYNENHPQNLAHYNQNTQINNNAPGVSEAEQEEEAEGHEHV